MNQPPSHPSPSSSHHRRPVYLTVHGPVSCLTSRVRFHALLAVVGSTVLFTAVVTPWRSVLDSCSMLASVPLAPVVGSFSLLPSHSFAFTGNDGPSPSSPFEVDPFTFKLYGSNSPSVGAGSLLLQNLAFHGPALNLRSHIRSHTPSLFYCSACCSPSAFRPSFRPFRILLAFSQASLLRLSIHSFVYALAFLHRYSFVRRYSAGC